MPNWNRNRGAKGGGLRVSPQLLVQFKAPQTAGHMGLGLVTKVLGFPSTLSVPQPLEICLVGSIQPAWGIIIPLHTVHKRKFPRIALRVPYLVYAKPLEIVA